MTRQAASGSLGTLVLIRHGATTHIHHGGAIDRAGLQRWRDGYDSAGLRAGSQPPARLVREAAEATHVIASDLPRAVASAERLAPGRSIQLSPLLREVPLGIPAWPTRLPLSAWALLIHLAWTYRIGRGTDATEHELARAVDAARWLAGIVADGSSAVVVTHGVFRRLLAKQLVEQGWQSLGRRGGYGHWSAWTLSGPANRVQRVSSRRRH